MNRYLHEILYYVNKSFLTHEAEQALHYSIHYILTLKYSGFLLQRVLYLGYPDRKLVFSTDRHGLYHCFYSSDERPEIRYILVITDRKFDYTHLYYLFSHAF
ncbi:hypothetical protein SAMN05421827_101622 [Pedobacter terrae]|uniref:Uncharacterized protein n=1 Tax=Pedobacter terrae TaxID=405671 RepID=A0A1G7P4L1_9SPHI|nr:hypothetical protein SAMN05421827_101622 [Pedobacter terrae]